MQRSLQRSDGTWLLTDGHAGNLRQARALAAALPCEVDREWTLAPSPTARRLAPRRWPGAARNAFGTAFASALQAPPALAIGCGRQGALATRLLRLQGARAVQILDPRIATRHWDAVIAPFHDGLHGSNVLQVHGSLNPVDDRWLAEARSAFSALLELPSPRVALLLGGSSAHLRDEDAVTGWFQCLGERVREAGGSLLATASRRTPPAWVAALYRARAGVPGLFWRGDGDGPNPYPGLLACAQHIVCTPDSVNMLSEAAATRVPVQVLAPRAMRGRPSRLLAHLIDSGRLHAFDGALELGESGEGIVPLRETARIAALLRERLGLPVQDIGT
ncbi:MAG: mitochondrial fission ELM1 family protein [Pseudoxanthomonas suwonensis]|nr:mitochondrial fission ELM1 family protein [Pseudoxanthomonas suwonensis]